MELLNELRVVLPGARYCSRSCSRALASRFGRVSHVDRLALFAGLMSTIRRDGILWQRPFYSRLRWGLGGKESDPCGNVFFPRNASGGRDHRSSLSRRRRSFGTAIAVTGAITVAALVVVTWYVLRSYAASAGHRARGVALPSRRGFSILGVLNWMSMSWSWRLLPASPSCLSARLVGVGCWRRRRVRSFRHRPCCNDIYLGARG